MDTPLTITEVALRSGLSAHTLRYYERAGLIAAVARGPGGQRRYALADMDWIGFLLRLRATRMSIAKMQSFARLRRAGCATLIDRRKMLEAHLSDVRTSIKLMQQSAHVLDEKIEHYRALERPSTQVPQPADRSHHAAKPIRTRPRKTA
jgi:DNA-binding transcriptional MerR regulator